MFFYFLSEEESKYVFLKYIFCVECVGLIWNFPKLRLDFRISMWMHLSMLEIEHYPPFPISSSI